MCGTLAQKRRQSKLRSARIAVAAALPFLVPRRVRQRIEFKDSLV